MFDNITQVMSPPEIIERERVLPATAEISSAVNDEIAQVKASIHYVGARSFPRRNGSRYNIQFLNTYMPSNEEGEEFSETGQYGTPQLSAEQEYFAFRKMNYLKFAALQEDTMMDMQSFLQESLELRETLTRANMALVKYIAREVGGGTPFYDEMLSEGSMLLFELIESYEPAKGKRFVDYAAPKLKSRLRNTLGAHRRGRAMETPVEPNDLHANPAPEKKPECPLGLYVDVRSMIARRKVSALLSCLDEREQRVITARFNLHYEGKKTLKQIGEELGLTRERIRQIETEALGKLAAGLEEEEDTQSVTSNETERLAA